MGRKPYKHLLVTESEKATETVETVEKAAVVEETAKPAPIKLKRDWSQKNHLNVPAEVAKKYSGMHFVWAKRDEDKLRDKEEMGYTYPKIEVDKRKTGSGTGAETSFITRKDLILMMISEEEYQDRVNYKREETLKQQASLQKTMGNRTAIKNLHSSLVVDETVKSD